MGFLWLTCEFTDCLATEEDRVTPQLFLALMNLGEVGRLQRFTQASDDPENTAWAPGIFCMQVYGPAMAAVLDVLLHQLREQLPAAESESGRGISLYVQIEARHYQLPVDIDRDDAQGVAQKIEAVLDAHQPGSASAG